MSLLKMLIADDEPYVRLGIRKTFNWEELGIEIVGECANGREVMDFVEHTVPHILICDVCMPIMDGLEVMRQLKEKNLNTKTIVLSGHSEFAYAQIALTHGALAYLLKPVDKEELRKEVLKAADTIHSESSKNQYVVELEHAISVSKANYISDILLGRIQGEANPGILAGTDISDTAFHRARLEIENYEIVMNVFTDKSLDDYEKEILDTFLSVCPPISVDEKLYTAISPGTWAFIWPGEFTYEELKLKSEEFFNKIKKLISFPFLLSFSEKFDDLRDAETAYQQAVQSASNVLLPGKNNFSMANVESHPIENEHVLKALYFLRKNFNKNIRIEDIAAESHISTYYLMHLFKKETGKTILETITDYRIQSAINLLRNTNKKVINISSEIGYKDFKYFCQVFKQRTGLTPSAYRESFK